MEPGLAIARARPRVARRGAAGRDHSIIAACVAFDALGEEYARSSFDCPPGTEAAHRATALQVRLLTAQRACLDRICPEAPSTLAGLRAVAASLVLFEPSLAAPDQADRPVMDRLVSAIVRGLSQSAAA